MHKLDYDITKRSDIDQRHLDLLGAITTSDINNPAPPYRIQATLFYIDHEPEHNEIDFREYDVTTHWIWEPTTNTADIGKFGGYWDIPRAVNFSEVADLLVDLDLVSRIEMDSNKDRYKTVYRYCLTEAGKSKIEHAGPRVMEAKARSKVIREKVQHSVSRDLYKMFPEHDPRREIS